MLLHAHSLEFSRNIDVLASSVSPIEQSEAARDRITQDLAKMLLKHPPQSASDSCHSVLRQEVNAECSSCDRDATARIQETDQENERR